MRTNKDLMKINRLKSVLAEKSKTKWLANQPGKSKITILK